MIDTPQQQPVRMTPEDWNAVPGVGAGDKVGGTRTYQGSEAQARPPWRCPACGVEQQGLLIDGCESCGSGKDAAKHVGIDPIVHKKDQVQSTSTGVRTVRTRPTAEPVNHLCFGAFLVWIDRLSPRPSPDAQARLLPAFTAGWQARQSTLDRNEEPVQIDGPEEIPTAVPIAESDAPAAEPLEGTIQSRTIVAALTFFADQVLKQQPEEIETGEWMQPDQIAALIEDVKGRYA